jgi:hypothetical protein
VDYRVPNIIKRLVEKDQNYLLFSLINPSGSLIQINGIDIKQQQMSNLTKYIRRF